MASQVSLQVVRGGRKRQPAKWGKFIPVDVDDEPILLPYQRVAIFDSFEPDYQLWLLIRPDALFLLRPYLSAWGEFSKTNYKLLYSFRSNNMFFERAKRVIASVIRVDEREQRLEHLRWQA